MKQKDVMKILRDFTDGVNYDKNQLAVFIIGIQESVDITQFASPKLNYKQMIEVLNGLRSGVDTSIYNKSNITHEEMLVIRKALEAGYNLKGYIDPGFSVRRISLIVEILKNGDEGFLKVYNKPEYSTKRLEILYRGFKKGFNLDFYNDLEKVNDSLANDIYTALYVNEDIGHLIDGTYSHYYTRELMLAVAEGLDTRLMENPSFSVGQGRQIRLGLAHGVNVDYADLTISVDNMKIRRRELRDEHLSNTTDESVKLQSAFEMSKDLIQTLE